jgi:hypothetical protein
VSVEGAFSGSLACANCPGIDKPIASKLERRPNPKGNVLLRFINEGIILVIGKILLI